MNTLVVQSIATSCVEVFVFIACSLVVKYEMQILEKGEATYNPREPHQAHKQILFLTQ